MFRTTYSNLKTYFSKGNSGSSVFRNLGLRVGISFYIWQIYIPRGKLQHGFVGYREERFSLNPVPGRRSLKEATLRFRNCKETKLIADLVTV